MSDVIYSVCRSVASWKQIFHDSIFLLYTEVSTIECSQATHACTHARTHARTHAHTHVCTQTRMHARTHTHTCMHTHIHTHSSSHWLGQHRKNVTLTYNMEGAAQRLECSASSISSTAAILSSVPLFHNCYIKYASVEVSITVVRGATDVAIWTIDEQIRQYATADSAGDDNLLTNPHHWI